MDTSQLLSVFASALGGVGIFLLGMRMMSEGLQALAGKRLHRWISAVTDNRFAAVLVGMGVTCLLQSSSATTVMVVGFVNSGLMTLMQGIAVVLGAHVGTTLSLWLLTLDIARYGGFLVGTAVFVHLFAKGERLRHAAMAALGLGMLFYGLRLLSDGFVPLRGLEEVRGTLAAFRADTSVGFLLAALAGMAVTALIQSSAAAVALVMGLAGAQAVDFQTAVALVLGSNVGTTATALLACAGASRNAVRTALANTLTTVLALLIVALLRVPFTTGCERLVLWLRPLGDASDPAAVRAWYTFAIACVHTLFNVTATVAFFPFLGLFARAVTWLVPVRPSERQEGWHPHFLDPRVLDQPAVALGCAQREILAMGQTCLDMLDALSRVFAAEKPDPADEAAVLRGEADLDTAQKEISEYIGHVLHGHGNLTGELAAFARRGIRQADEFESLSDCIRGAHKSHAKIRQAGETLTPAAIAEITDLCTRMASNIRLFMALMAAGDTEGVFLAEARCRDLDDAAKRYRAAHMERIGVSCLTPMKSLVYSDLLVAFRRQNDHLLNLVQTLSV
ncbi:MAG: Na/Pi cotransporter family protein [Kiritimatiellae bacterium]|nr:Na/Pi cotransporter family protein [Kiritimatiellia bacterium]